MMHCRSTPLLLAAGSLAVAMGGLAFSNGDTLIERGFQRAMSTVGETTSAVARDEVVPPAGGIGELQLARVETLADGDSLLGERIRLALDGSAAIELEVIAQSQLAATASGTGGSGRMLMLTCREVMAQEVIAQDLGDLGGTDPRRPRIVRLIVDADNPLDGVGARSAPRAL